MIIVEILNFMIFFVDGINKRGFKLDRNQFHYFVMRIES